MEYFKKIVKESIVIVLLTSFLGLISGIYLSDQYDLLSSIPIFIMVIPPLNACIGDLSTILISKFTTYLYIGSIPPKIQKSETLINNFIALLVTGILSVLFLSIISIIISPPNSLSILNPVIYTFILLFTIVILFAVFFVICFISAIFLFKHGRDPNNIMIPTLTSTADLITPIILLIILQIILPIFI